MAQPQWVTPAGSLGTIPEGVFYSTPLVAVEPDIGDTIYYQLIAGSLPAGLQIQQTGLMTGVPQAQVNFQGVPALVSRDVTSKFAVRAYTRTTVNGITVINRLADRTFEITVVGQDIPQWITPAGQVAQVFDGSLVEGIQLQYTDTDPDDRVVVKLIAGQLPPGLSISSTGLISGFIGANPSIGAVAGFSRDGQGYDQYPFDFTTQSIDYNYEFVLEVTDGKVNGSSLRTFSIYVWSRSSLTADNTVITADNTFITADGSPIRPPILLTPEGSIGTIRSDNFFAFQFQGIDVDGDRYNIFKTPASTLPPGLTLDPDSGWLYGYVPDLGITENTYDFDLIIEKDNAPDAFTGPYNYSLTITGPISSEIIWITPSDLGTIINGSTSTLYVQAVNRGGLELQYQLLSGSNSNLPQGLSLLPSGEIAGRVSFDTFAVDQGTTTFDVSKTNGANPTTFDLTFTFVVNAYSVNGVVNVNKTFSITVIREFNKPYENLYIQAMPPLDDRDLINSLIQNSDIFPPASIYRPQDPYFGVAKDVTYYHAYGLNSAIIEDYYSSLYENHYWKNLVLGSIKTAQARDGLGNVIYEVVYSDIQDNLVNNDNKSVSKQVELPYPVDYANQTNITTVYPNSLINMRDQVIDVVGQISNMLPLWMTSKQANGQILGFTPAWVIAYVKPGEAERVAYYIKTNFGERLNLIDFEVDRYELDRYLSHNWDPAVFTVGINNISGNGNTVTVTYATQSTAPAVAGTNITISGVNPSVYNGSYVVETCTTSQITFNSSTSNAYVSGGTLTIPSQWVPPPAETTFDYPADPPLTPEFGQWGNYNYEYTVFTPVNWVDNSNDPVVWTNTYNGQQTIFDGDSLKFIAPVDMYVGTLTNAQIYDKYLVFPKRNILE
jgi:hypothetical protein